MSNLNDLKIRQIIFTDLDAVTGPLFIRMLWEKYGKVDVIHTLRRETPGADRLSRLEMLKLTTKYAVSTCWSVGKKFNESMIREYEKWRGWEPGSVRVYTLVNRSF
jgi:hypothetical protein